MHAFVLLGRRLMQRIFHLRLPLRFGRKPATVGVRISMNDCFWLRNSICNNCNNHFLPIYAVQARKSHRWACGRKSTFLSLAAGLVAVPKSLKEALSKTLHTPTQTATSAVRVGRQLHTAGPTKDFPIPSDFASCKAGKGV